LQDSVFSNHENANAKDDDDDAANYCR